MEEFKSENKLDFFAAANTYNGFVSYFDKVFPSEEFDRIYVLKGGPGTGKSSFMKKVSATFKKSTYRVENIYCSSDPNSLDGVIISGDNKKVAILDGTAPHERDAKIPGAVDEIINLGEQWDKAWLTAQRKEIIDKVALKDECYKSAYDYLNIAGAAYRVIKSTYLPHFDKPKAKYTAESILQDIPRSKDGVITTRLISSFGRFGEYRLSTFQSLPVRKIFVGGDEICASIFLDICMSILRTREVNILHCPTALDPCSTDAIYLPDYNLVITRRASDEVNADHLFNLSQTDRDKINKATQLHSDAIFEAKRWFNIASDIHFSLEEIYSRAMNFYKTDLLIDKTIDEIGIILEKAI